MSNKQLPQQELLNTQLSEEKNLNNSNYSEEIIKREPIHGTPFHLISSENKYFIAFGRYRISEIKNSEDEALLELDMNNQGWNTVTNLIILIIETSKEETK